jgi:hypothetical protein
MEVALGMPKRGGLLMTEEEGFIDSNGQMW